MGYAFFFLLTDRQDSLTFKGPQVNLPTPPVVVKKYAKIRYAKPTITAYPDFDPETWATELRKSIKVILRGRF